MKTLFIILIVIFCVSLGYFSGTSSNKKLENELLDELSKSSNQSPNGSLNYAISVATDQLKVSQGVQSQLETIGLALDKLRHSQKDDDLYRFLGNDALGVNFRRALIISNYAQELPGSELYLENFMNSLKKNPTTGIKDIQEALNRVPKEGYPLERAELLRDLSEIPGASEEAKKISLTELTTNKMPARPDPSTAKNQTELNEAFSVTDDVILPTTAYSVFLKNVSSNSEALQGTIDGIVAQPDLGVRKNITSQFIATYPDMKEQLISALKNHQIQIPNIELTGVPQ